MLHKIDLENDNAVGFSWEGELDEKALKQSLVQFLPELQSRSSFNVYLEVHDLSNMQAKAIWEELKFSVRNIQEMMEKIDKVALATNMDWMRTMAGMVPGPKMKTFKLDEKDAAKLWVTKE